MLVVLGAWLMPGIGELCATGAGGAAIGIGLPATGPGIGKPCGAWLTGESAVGRDAVVVGWRPELSDMNVAAPSTSATAAPAARPRPSRRFFCEATTGNAFW